MNSGSLIYSSIVSLALVLLIGPNLVAAVEVTVTSQNIKTHLEAKNLKVSAARISLKGAEEREGSLTRSFLPTVDLYAGQESFKTGSLSQKTQPVFGVEAKLNVFNGGRDQAESEVRSLEVKRRGDLAQRILSEELEKARALYWQILFLREKQILLQASLKVNQENLKSAKRRIRAGVATNSDRFEFEMKAVDLKREVLQAGVQFASEVRILKLLLGLKENSRISFSEDLNHDHEYESVVKHSEEQHEFLYSENQIQAEQYSLLAKGARREWWPRLDAFIAYSQYNEGRESSGPGTPKELRKETILGLRLSMSVASGFESRRESAALANEALASRSLAIYKRQEVEAHLLGEMAELKSLHDQVHEAEENILRAKRYYKMTQSEYKRGAKNSPDVLGASEKLFSTKLKHLEIIKNFQISKAHIFSKIGH